MSEPIVDGREKQLVVGSRVRIFGYDKRNPETEPDDEWYGTVTEITDLDGDVDDEGRSIGIWPEVKVRFDNGDDESFRTHWTATGPWDDDAPYMCDDVELVEGAIHAQPGPPHGVEHL